MENPTVFISYSHDSEEHKAWVLKLATDLRTHGVDAILDQWDLRLGTDLRFFMENGLSSSHLVLCVCSEDYVQKVNNGKGGSGYEGSIMTQALLQNATANYIIPIVRNNTSKQKVPFALGSKLYVDFSDDSQYFPKYQELLERIYGEDVKRKPPLGDNPFSPLHTAEIDVKTKIAMDLYCNPAMSGNVTFRHDNNNGKYILGTGEYKFVTNWSTCGIDSIYAYGLAGRVGWKDELKRFPTLAEVYDFDFTSSTRRLQKGDVFVYRNEHEHFVAIKIGNVYSRSHGNQYDELSFEYIILTK